MERSERMFPVHVLVESVRPNHCLTCAHDGNVINDTYAIINAHTQLNNVVETVLSALGMPQLVQDSRGLIQINNWKPLPFESITDNQEELAANLFKEISNNITLKILTKHGSVESHSSQCLTQLKDRILKMAVEKQPQFLGMVDNQEIKTIMQQVLAGSDVQLSETQIQSINDWMDNLTENSNFDRKSPRSTVRFSPISELPLLERWFKSEQNPSKPTLIKHMNHLNSAPYRKSNPKVTYQQICNWFTNQRAAAREQNASNASATALATAVQQISGTGGFQWPNSPASNALAAMLSQPLNLSFGNQTPRSNAATPIPATPPQTNSAQIPLSNQPMDIRSKFDNANGYNPLNDRNDTERIDGGSESPTGNDDASDHSASENCGFDAELKESLISSPDLSIDLSAFSPQQTGNARDLNATMAAALQSIPMSLFNTAGLGGFSLNGDNVSQSLAQFAAAQSQANGISTQSLLPTDSDNHRHSTRSTPHHRAASASTQSAATNGSSAQNPQNGPGGARSRLMFDPLSELPILERWFEENPHPGWLQIEQYTDSLNSLPYRQNYPPISTHNVKIWFKNRRAKCKRLNTDPPSKIALSAN
ncbi:hypothetical protein M3Y94_00736000 [Aphelenchoides besseyi]|nr:hypothetical protein M3Y94_00736000 [Aphelenchoides besseyi]KAI6231933.1 hypothetical protein M3Y95_00433900 [Aphelenchoides besseyi]